MTVWWAWRAVVLMWLVALMAAFGLTGMPAQGGDDLAALRAQVSQLYSQAKYGDANPIAERYVALARQKYGQNHIEYAAAISWLAYVYKAQGRYAEAEPLYKRSVSSVPAPPPLRVLYGGVRASSPLGSSSKTAFTMRMVIWAV
jgi:tetratricopeptide (TPR) repeat protein